MNICCISFNLSNSDIIGIVNIIVLFITAGILLYTLLAIKTSNEENTRLNRLQAAENTIVKQLEFHYNMLKGINIINSTGKQYGEYLNRIVYGQTAFEVLYDTLKDIYVKMPGNSYKDSNDIAAEERRIKDSFTQLYNEYGSQFGNYFKNLYLLISYINDITIKDFNKKYYISLVKSQLSKYEILLLAYNCIWIQIRPKPKGRNFIEFAKEYDLLSALELNELIESVSSVNHKEIFNNYGITFYETIGFTN